MGAGRHDFRDRIQQKPGKRTVSYPFGSTAYPKIIEGLASTKGATDGSIPFLSAHPARATFPLAQLVEQNSDKGDDNANNITLVYVVLPGLRRWKPGFDMELGAKTSEYRQEVAMPSAPDTPGGFITSPVGDVQLILDSYIEPINGSTVYGEKVTECISIPPSRTEADSIGYEFPAQFTFIGAWVAPPPVAAAGIPGPYAGVNYTLTAHRTLSTPASTVISYSNGDPGSLPAIYRVTTPGVADRFFGIQPNTIHAAIFVQGSSGSFTQIIEDLAASTPSSYSPGSTLTIRASKRLVKGTLWEKRISAVAE